MVMLDIPPISIGLVLAGLGLLLVSSGILLMVCGVAWGMPASLSRWVWGLLGSGVALSLVSVIVNIVGG